jgi:hypothetical protein
LDILLHPLIIGDLAVLAVLGWLLFRNVRVPLLRPRLTTAKLVVAAVLVLLANTLMVGLVWAMFRWIGYEG